VTGLAPSLLLAHNPGVNEPNQALRPATLCVRAGTHVDEATGGVCSPIFTSTAYGYPNAANQTLYPRYFNVPNQQVVARKLAALEKGEAAMVFGSGMAAISTVLFSHLKAGDHALFQADLYGGTHHFVTTELERFGIEVSLARTPDEFASLLKPNTRVLYVESPSNPLVRVIDLAAVVRLGRAQAVLTVIDNTFATPINQNPLELGFDVVVHSGTKYLNGHSDVNCGAVIASARTLERVGAFAVNHGGTLDAHACYLLERGLKTLALRVRQQNETAQRLATFLAGHPVVARVNYPGLPGSPDHALAARQMRGFGGMLSFELRRPEAVDAVLAGLRLITPAVSLGGVETLISQPCRTSHAKLSPADRRAAGISDGLLRLSVGIEDTDDLCADLAQALAKAVPRRARALTSAQVRSATKAKPSRRQA
jgi:cystathionine beta-lyase